MVERRSRLIAFGCSYTYGMALPDCWEPVQRRPGRSYSNLAWPTLLANKLNRRAENFSRPGASNKEIWHKAINFNFEKHDMAVIGWTFLNRFCILNKNPTKIKSFGTWMVGKEMASKLYYQNFYDEYDLQQDFICRYEHLQQKFKEKGIEVYNFSFDTGNIPFYKEHVPSLTMVTSTYVDRGLDGEDVGGGHPGVETHKAFASLMSDAIINLKDQTR